ncbi:TetR/AcrR family transcriptional regulator [Seohaeicola saemankumensis]|nr:TetR/AcrR family transcriptional regulator [Seohaeicola saemankumensis]MCA0869404.1 TetR/AcrR family transcriptional regulator [Seohaeicola saemankumensis]
MNDFPAKLQARAARKTAKRDEKKRQIAASALNALKELGYANTSLRDIAEKSDMSLGMLHYYFEDRSDLIIYCVSIYKREFVRAVTKALTAASGRDEVIEAFSEALVTSIIEDEMTHRLWYDIRNQAMFDVTFRPVVSEIETMLIGTVGAAFDKAGHKIPPEQVAIYYALVDGAFRYLMQDQFSATPRSRRALQAIFRDLLAQFF